MGRIKTEDGKWITTEDEIGLVTEDYVASTDIDGVEADHLLSKYDCDVCGFTFYKRQLKKRYDGAMVCSRDYEERHPRDRGRYE